MSGGRSGAEGVPRRGSNREGGTSLVEALVALAVTAILALAALRLQDECRRSFRRGEAAAEQQQAVRAAWDRMLADFRRAGFNHDPDGDPGDGDEPLEAAFDTAIVVRGDYDAEDPAQHSEPEVLLAGVAQPSVAVGNDEIVAYVLAKPNGSSPGTLRFDADVREVPRDGVPETVGIPRVALVHDDPPYTLYRVTLNSDVASWGSGGFFVRTPVLDNVRAMTFRYYGTKGLLNRFDLASEADDIGGSEIPAARRTRSAVVRIEAEIETVARDPDPKWSDPRDSNPATRAMHKFHLGGAVVPRNQGFRGRPDAASPNAAPLVGGA